LCLIPLEGLEHSDWRLAQVILSKLQFFSPSVILLLLRIHSFIHALIHSFIVWEMDSGLVSGRSSDRRKLMPTQE
jgi:hypothetical protein